MNKKPHAQIAVSHDGRVLLMQYYKDCPDWVKENIDEFNFLDEVEETSPMGLYDIVFEGKSCGGNRCTSYNCPGDCFEMDYEII